MSERRNALVNSAETSPRRGLGQVAPNWWDDVGKRLERSVLGKYDASVPVLKIPTVYNAPIDTSSLNGMSQQDIFLAAYGAGLTESLKGWKRASGQVSREEMRELQKNNLPLRQTPIGAAGYQAGLNSLPNLQYWIPALF